MGFQLATSNRTYELIVDPDVFDTAGTYYPWTFSILADMDASDTCYMTWNWADGNAPSSISTTSFFSGCLVA